MSATEHYETVACDECGDTFERHKKYADQPKQCEACYEQATIEWLRKCLDPDHDGAFSRPKALDRLKDEYRQMPIVDYDGSLITELDVQYGRGIGAEPDGWWIEEIERLHDCPACGYPRATTYRKTNCYQHVQHHTQCPKCGHTDESY